jgi:hypothetical protein
MVLSYCLITCLIWEDIHIDVKFGATIWGKSTTL